MTLASPITGIFLMANTVKRSLPSVPNDPVTHESIHSSVLNQASVSPLLSEILRLHPNIVSPLLPFEEEMKMKWAHDPSSPSALAYKKKLLDQSKISKTASVSAKQADKPDQTLLGTIFSCFS